MGYYHGDTALSLWRSGLVCLPVLPGLETLDATQHVQVSSGVLLDHVLHIVRPEGLLKLLLGHVELHDPGTEPPGSRSRHLTAF